MKSLRCVHVHTWWTWKRFHRFGSISFGLVRYDNQLILHFNWQCRRHFWMFHCIALQTNSCIHPNPRMGWYSSLYNHSIRLAYIISICTCYGILSILFESLISILMIEWEEFYSICNDSLRHRRRKKPMESRTNWWFFVDYVFRNDNNNKKTRWQFIKRKSHKTSVEYLKLITALIDKNT